MKVVEVRGRRVGAKVRSHALIESALLSGERVAICSRKGVIVASICEGYCAVEFNPKQTPPTIIYDEFLVTTTMRLHYFDDAAAGADDLMLNMAKGQGYVPKTCLLGGMVVMAEVQDGRDPCAGCNGPRAKCHGRPNSRP